MTHAYWGTILSRGRQRGPALRTCSKHRRARQHDHRLHGRQRPAQRRARHGGQAHHARAEHPHRRRSCAIPGSRRRTSPRSIEQQVLTVDMAPSLLELCGAPAAAKTSTADPGCKLVREGDPPGASRWLYEYNYEKQFPYTPNVRGVRTETLEIHPLPARRRRPRPAHGRALQHRVRPGRASQPDRQPEIRRRGQGDAGRTAQGDDAKSASRRRTTRCRSTRASSRNCPTRKSAERSRRELLKFSSRNARHAAFPASGGCPSPARVPARP